MHGAARRIRSHLDHATLLRATVDEVVGALPGARASVWLADPQGSPRLAYPIPEGGSPPAPPHVIGSVNRRKRLRDASLGAYAFPLMTARSGVLGVLYVEALDATWTAEVDEIFEDIANEAALALETSNLFMQAAAQRERSEAILARVADAVVVTDGHGSVRQFNRSAVEIFHFDSQAAAGRTCEQLLGLRLGERPLDCSTGCALLKLASASGPGVEVARTLDDGRKQPLLGNAAAVVGLDGVISEVVHSFRDITSLKEADEAKTMFLATASHELKTPLTVIRGFSEMLMGGEGLGSEGADSAVEAIARRSVELNRIVDRILLSSRIESGRVEVSISEVDVVPLLMERTDAFARATGRWVRAIIEPRLPLVRCDPEAFGSAIDHLIDNALKYSPEGGSVDVHARALPAAVSIEVIDHGIGMSAEHAGRAFEKFFQAESSDVRRFGGTGIGLYIVRSLIEAMGGQVDVESHFGRGSTFSISLQRSDAITLDHVEASLEPVPADAPEPSVIREFMRQMGIPTTNSTAGGGR